jgi:VCBS repeat-containing protein
MGIRGTLVNAEINADSGQVRFSVLREPNGEVGRYDLIRDERVIATVSAVDQVTVVAPSGIVTTEPKSFQQQQAEELLVQQIFQIFSLGQANPLLPGTGPTGPGPGTGPGGGGGGGSSTDPNLNNGGTPNGAPGLNPTGPSGPNALPVPPPNFQPVGNPDVGGGQPAGGVGGAPGRRTQPNGGAEPPGGGDGENPLPPGPFTIQAQVVDIGEDEATGGGPGALFGSEAGGAQRVVSARAAGGSSGQVQPGNEPTLVSGEFGTFAVRQDGTYAYAPFRANSLARGETATESFEYVVDDGAGRTATTTITFDIAGENDAPSVMSAVLADDIAENGGVQSVDLLEGAADLDRGAVLRVENLRLSGSPEGELPPGITLFADGRRLLVDADDPTFNGLRPGDVQTLSFAYEIVDEFGAGVGQTATLVVRGTNDAPTVAGSLFRSVQENTGSNTLDLLAGATDVDNGAVLRVENLRLSGSPEGELPPASRSPRTAARCSSIPTIPPTRISAPDKRGPSASPTMWRTSFGARVAQTATVVINGADEPIGFDGSFETGFTGWDRSGDTPLSRAEPRGCRPRGSRPLPRPASHSLRSRRSWA